MKVLVTGAYGQLGRCIPILKNYWLYNLSTCITNYENNMNHKNKEYKILYGKDLY